MYRKNILKSNEPKCHGFYIIFINVLTYLDHAVPIVLYVNFFLFLGKQAFSCYWNSSFDVFHGPIIVCHNSFNYLPIWEH